LNKIDSEKNICYAIKLDDGMWIEADEMNRDWSHWFKCFEIAQ